MADRCTTAPSAIARVYDGEMGREWVVVLALVAGACGGGGGTPSAASDEHAAPESAAPALAPEPVVAPGATEIEAPPSPAIAAAAAPPSPVLVPAARGWGPYPSVCEGLAHVEVGDALGRLSCESEEPYVRATLATPASPFDEVRVLFAGSGEFPGHDEMGALLLSVRSGASHHLFVLDVHEGNPIGFGPMLSLDASDLRVERSGAAARLVLTARHTAAEDYNYDAPAAGGVGLADAFSEMSQIFCALEDGVLACASLVIGGAGAVDGRTGDVTGGARWSVTATLIEGDRVNLGTVEGPAPGDLDIARPRQLVFDDVARTRARTLSGRCHRLLEAGELEEADAACLAGLAEHPSRDEHGALLYDRGRIAEARGDVGGAREAYTESLVVRPLNAVVRARLDALPAAE